MKKTRRLVLPVALLAVVLTVVLMIPAVIMPSVSAATVTTYAENTFEDLTVGANIKNDSSHFYNTVPSRATVQADGDNKIIKLETVPAISQEASGDTQFIVIGSGAYNVVDNAVTYKEVSYPVGEDGKVWIGDTGYTIYKGDRAKEILVGGDNVDKNIMLKNSAMSYETEDKIYLQVEYYLSEDAKGSVQSQFLTYWYEGGPDEGAYWYHIFNLKLDVAGVQLGSGGVIRNVLTRKAWNTVTVAINLDDGNRELYVNNCFIASDNCGKTNLTFAENSWIVAKLNKGSSVDTAYDGYICIDDAKACTMTDANVLTYEAEDASGNKLAYVEATTSTGRVVDHAYEGADQKFFRESDENLEPQYLVLDDYSDLLYPVKGASVRLSHAAGIRFATQINVDRMETLLDLEEHDYVESVSIGTLITPKTYVERAGAITFEALDALNVTGAKYINVKATVGQYYPHLPAGALEDGFDAYFVGSITNVKLGNRGVDFSAVGYAEVKLTSGEAVHFYSYEYDSASIGDYSRSVEGVAEAALSDQNATWTEEERLVLQSFANGAQNFELSSTSIIKEVQYTTNEVFFQNAAGVSCRLTYEGKNGWRFQANKESYDGFDETGAGQALSIYLGETVIDKTKRLYLEESNGKLKITADGTTTYVTLATASSFDMSFYSGQNKQVSQVTSVAVNTLEGNSVADTAVVLTGNLASGEGVYGGGERFDVVNQRGNAFQLYTRDNYNSTAGTYVAIPLFVTTRGAGMFINRYENMAVDFGNSSSNQWSVTLNNDLMDCYFYATGRMSDALLGYTAISGHSSLPEEWAQGELICRYSPDMANFEDRIEYTQSYESHKKLYGNDYKKYGVNTKGVSDSDIENYENYYVKKTSWGSTSYVQISSATSGFGTSYDYNTLYTDDTASTVAFAKLSDSLYYPMGKKWATLEEADAFGVGYFHMNYLFELTYTDGVATGITTSYAYCYYKGEDGFYHKAGAKGNPAGYGVKTIVQNLIDAGMKPTAMVMEPFGWGNISTNPTKYEELKNTVIWLEERGIKSMFYMGVGGIGNSMAGYKPEYQVWATKTYTDTSKEPEQIYQIPKTSGTGTNPDVGNSATQSYIDVTNPQAMKWYLDEIWGMMIDLGADGIKIDFCECMPDEGTYGSGADEYTLTYDWYDPSVFEGDEVHHAYATYFISMFYQSMLEQKEAKNIPDGFTVLSRGGGIGSQRNPYLWEGDQERTFEKIEDQLIALINCGISGVPFMTYDMAGYAYGASGEQIRGLITLEKESEIFARAIEYTAFTSNIQTHGDVRHAYEMTEETQEIYRNFTALHEELIPYIQRASEEACRTGMPVVRAMVLEYQDDANVYGLETQYMLGEGLLVAPVLGEGERSKDVYLPAGTWLNLLTGDEIETTGEYVTVDVPLGQIPVFMNMDCSVEDNNLIAEVFNGDTWKKIVNDENVEINIEILNPKGDPYVEDPFVD